MNGKPSDQKSIHRQKQRRLILKAAARVVQEEGAHAFSVQQVADKAGISHRTVYRYFPTREDLLENLIYFYEEHIRDINPPPPDNLEGLPESVGALFQRFSQFPNECSVGALTALMLGKQIPNRARRDAEIIALTENSMPPDSEISPREAGAVIRYLANSLAWIVLRQQLGLSEDETARAIQWALRILIAEIKKDSAGQD